MTLKQRAINFVKDIAYVGVFFLVFTTFGYASFHIPSGSMEPTLEVGDRIMVAKFSYGYNRYSVPFDPPIFEDRILEDLPSRGDIVVFTLPHRNHTDFIKRVVGLPGDRIQVRDGRLYINGEVTEREFRRTVNYESYNGYQIRVREFTETLPGGINYSIYERTDSGRGDNTGIYVVPPDHYFMMGDNRDGSSDSRDMATMGFVHKKFLVGRAHFTTFSLYNCGQGKPVGCALGVPYDRFFNILN